MRSCSRAKTLANLSHRALISGGAEFVPGIVGANTPAEFDERRSTLGVVDGKSSERLRIPCFSAFRRATALPASVLGPVERLALARLACSFRSDIGRLLRKSSRCPESGSPCLLRVIRSAFTASRRGKTHKDFARWGENDHGREMVANNSILRRVSTTERLRRHDVQ